MGGVYTESLDFVDGTAIRRGIGEVNDKSRIVTGSTEDDTVIYIGMLVNVWGHHLTDNIKRLWFLIRMSIRVSIQDVSLCMFLQKDRLHIKTCL